MYCDYFGFKQEPFTIAPDPAFLYPSSPHRQALAHLKYGLDREGGFILLTGEVGTGKTTLTRLLLQHIPAVFRVAYVLNAKLGIQDVLASICDELHISLDVNAEKSPKTYIDAINVSLLQAHAQGFKTLVVIEEAQNLEEEVLEMLRLLTNLETDTCKLLHILLVGQPELLELIGRPQLRQLNQRVVSRFHLDPLDLAETEKYLAHRMQKAGCSRKIFSRSAVRAIYKLSDGIPRKINLLAERALLGAYSLNKESVEKTEVRAANREVFGLRVHKSIPNQRLAKISLVVSCLMISAILIVIFLEYKPAQEPLVAASLDPTPTDTNAVKTSGSELATTEELNLDGQFQLPAELESETDSQVIKVEPIDNISSTMSGSADTAIFSRLDQLIIDDSQALEDLVPSNPYEQFLNIWGIEDRARSLESFCLVAASEGLLCEQTTNTALWYFRSVNRPQLVQLLPGLNPSETAAAFYLLSGISDDMFLLERMGQEYSLFSSELDALIAGPSTYLWKPPIGYFGSIRVGESNREVLSWLQPRLADIDAEASALITGGRYSQPISGAVAKFQGNNSLAEDGILGRLTLLKFNELDGMVPTLGQGVN